MNQAARHPPRWACALLASLGLGAWAPAAAHCGPNENCVYAPCHHGPGDPECQASTNGAKLTGKIQQPEIKAAVGEIIVPKVPQLNLPVGGGAKAPPNLPAPPGKLDVRAQTGKSLPFPPNLPPSAIARDVAPQVYADTFTAAREIDNQRAMEELRKKHPKLAGSSWLNERRTLKLGETFKELERINSRAQQAKEALGDDPRYQGQRQALEKAAGLLQTFGSGDAARTR
jgi:hypothetical protein